MLIVDDASKVYGRLVALKPVTLSLAPGDFLVIFGSNGAGKSTLMGLMASLMRPSDGRVLFRDADIHKDTQSYRRHIGVLSHASYLYADLTGRENLEFYAALYDVPSPPARIEVVLTQVGLQGREHDLVRGYSRGMLQRLALARTFLHNPTVLFLDEPYTGLDRHAVGMLNDMITGFRTADHIGILTTHDLERGWALATRVAILRRGQLVHLGGRDEQTLDDFRQIYEQYVSEGDR